MLHFRFAVPAVLAMHSADGCQRGATLGCIVTLVFELFPGLGKVAVGGKQLLCPTATPPPSYQKGAASGSVAMQMLRMCTMELVLIQNA